MTVFNSRRGRQPFAALALLLAALLALAAPASSQSREDVPEVTRTFAIENARVVQAPGRVLENATVVVRDGLIASVGRGVAVPFDAERIDGTSLTVYAGFIDALSHAGIPEPAREAERVPVENSADPPREVAGIQPDRTVTPLLKPDDDSVQALRKLGFTAAHVVPRGRMLPGAGTVVLLAGERPEAMVLKPEVSLFAQFAPASGVYPGTPMAIIAQMRQLFREADRRRTVERLYAQNPAGLERPPYDPVHGALYPVLAGERPVFFRTRDTEGALEIHRALALHRELGFPVVLAGLQQSFDAIDLLQEAGVPLVLTLELPEPPKQPADTTAADTTVAAVAAADTVAADTRRAMTPDAPDSFFLSDHRTATFEDVAAERTVLEARRRQALESHYATAAALHDAGLTFAVMTMDAKPETIRKNLRRMVDAGLPEEAALAALTTHGARILGLSQTLGTIEPGKIANLVVTRGSYFDEDGRVRYVFVDGRRFEYEEPTGVRKMTEQPAAAEAGGEGGGSGVGAAAETGRTGEAREARERGEVAGETGRAGEARERGEAAAGTGRAREARERGEAAAGTGRAWEARERGEAAMQVEPPAVTQLPLRGDLLVRNGTVLTVTRGTLEGTDILVRDGKIAQIGQGLPAPSGVHVVDATGHYVMPGIIDAHSHIAVSSINEMTSPVTAEVGVGDVLNPYDVRIYRALAGGVTISHVMHGSANVIGGRNETIKHRYGVKNPDLLRMDGAPRTIKFALGENPTRVHGRRGSAGQGARNVPATRMGVEFVLRKTFTDGVRYREGWDRFERERARNPRAVPPAYDERLEVIAGILRGDILVHTHSYRADEILMLLDVLEDFGIDFLTLQHVNEGFKVAPELASFGAMASVFADWWAYKFEVYYSTAYNAAILTRNGVTTSINSDSPELNRHLYHEAAKTQKYGDLSDDEALALITINAARQLGISDRTGSIEVGKDADLAIFDGHPLSVYAIPRTTIVDGVVRFDFEADPDDMRLATPPDEALDAMSEETRHEACLDGVDLSIFDY